MAGISLTVARWASVAAVLGIQACVAAPDGAPALDCTDPCEVKGRCQALDGQCVATTDSDCWNSLDCKLAALCSAAPDGTCKVMKDEDCKRGLQTSSQGHGKASGGTCVLDDCTKAYAHRSACNRKGLCTPVKGKCIAETDADCEASQGCLFNGLCTAKQGVCIASREEDCAAALRCNKCVVCHEACAETCDGT